MSIHHWRDYIPEDLKQFNRENKFGGRLGFGKTPAVLIIDMQFGGLGEKGEPIEISVKKYPHSAGEIGWKALDYIRELADLARTKRVPVVYTKMRKPSPGIKPFRTKFPASR